MSAPYESRVTEKSSDQAFSDSEEKWTVGSETG
jgi:hypothetical protein